MKIQDISFGIVLVLLLLVHKPRLLVVTGLSCLVLAMPLFYFHVFFTAERLTWYAGGLFVTFVILNLFQDPDSGQARMTNKKMPK